MPVVEASTDMFDTVFPDMVTVIIAPEPLPDVVYPEVTPTVPVSSGPTVIPSAFDISPKFVEG